MSEGEVARAIEDWFRAHARRLPWRETDERGERDPYHALVSEFMLQQTQVSRVVDRFSAFVDRFPDVQSLATAPEEDVLAMWSGLGYYSRAKRLHAAAKAIVTEYGGRVPKDVEDLRSLPGVGRYTAGAIASMVFGERAALVDGNVQRVLVRLHGEERRLADRATEAWSWERAGVLVERCGDPGVFNEGLMELGATVCTPRGARCSACPVRAWCVAAASGRQEELPLPKAKATRCEVWHGVAVCVREGRVLLIKRPSEGLWADLWAPPSVERADRAPTPAEIEALVGASGSPIEGFTHETTHRRVRFLLWRVELKPTREPGGARWCSVEEVRSLGVSNAHLRIVKAVLGEP
ncbi:MAG: A/G-specific adenine glycosylase [Phycisphaerales bacterium]